MTTIAEIRSKAAAHRAKLEAAHFTDLLEDQNRKAQMQHLFWEATLALLAKPNKLGTTLEVDEITPALKTEYVEWHCRNPQDSRFDNVAVVMYSLNFPGYEPIYFRIAYLMSLSDPAQLSYIYTHTHWNETVFWLVGNDNHFTRFSNALLFAEHEYQRLHKEVYPEDHEEEYTNLLWSEEEDYPEVDSLKATVAELKAQIEALQEEVNELYRRQPE